MFKLVTLVLLQSFCLLSAVHESSSLPWSATRRLTWADFRSRPDENATNAALTSSKIVFSYAFGSQKGFTYTVNCYFDKNNSWGRIKTDYILSHEQGHFDVTEIFARKLNKALKAYSFDPKTVSTEVPALYQRLMKQEKEWQNQYDAETDYSRNKPEQARWLQKIQAELDALTDYSNYAGNNN